MREYWFCCPKCNAIGSIDEDQLLGRVSILHEECGFHETGFVKPAVPITESLLKDVRPTIER